MTNSFNLTLSGKHFICPSKEEHTKTHHHKLPKIKDKERILEAAREKETVTYKRVPIRLSADFSKETL